MAVFGFKAKHLSKPPSKIGYVYGYPPPLLFSGLLQVLGALLQTN